MPRKIDVILHVRNDESVDSVIGRGLVMNDPIPQSVATDITPRTIQLNTSTGTADPLAVFQSVGAEPSTGLSWAKGGTHASLFVLNASTGVLTWPAQLAAGNYSITVSVTNAVGQSAAFPVSIVVDQVQQTPAPHTDITVGSLATATNGYDLTAQLSATGGYPAAATFSVSGIPGFTVSSNGRLTVPGNTANGTYTGSVTATNGSNTHSRDLTVLLSSPVADQRHLEITVEGHAPVVADLASVVPAPPSGALQTFTIANTSTATTPVLTSVGLPFGLGDVPSGSVPVIKRGAATITAQFDNRVTWPNGSLKYAVATFRDADLPGDSEYSYNVSAQAGSFNETSAITLSEILAAHDYRVDLTNVSTNISGIYRSTATPGASQYLEATYEEVAFGGFGAMLLGRMAPDNNSYILCGPSYGTDSLAIVIRKNVNGTFSDVGSFVITKEPYAGVVKLEIRNVATGVECKAYNNGKLLGTRTINDSVFANSYGVGIRAYPYSRLSSLRAGNIGGTEVLNLNLGISDRPLSESTQMTLVSSEEAAWIEGGKLHSRGQVHRTGTLTARFADAAAVPTRMEISRSGPLGIRIYAWQMFKDVNGEDAHLKIDWFVDGFDNGSGGLRCTRVSAVIAQDWWGVAGKGKLFYHATLRDGAATMLQTQYVVPHAYAAWWTMIRADNDAQHATPLWRGISTPTLLYRLDKAYWASTGVIPPLNPNTSPAPGGYQRTYRPMWNAAHRQNIEGGGSYKGRGLIPEMCARDFACQSAESRRQALVSAFDGMHKPQMRRMEYLRKRPGDAVSDIANTCRAPKMDGPYVTNVSEYDFQADGMPAPRDGGTDIRGFTDGYVVPSGGTNAWAISHSTAHAPSHSYYSYLVTGEDYYLNHTLCEAMNAFTGWPYNETSTTPKGPQFYNMSTRRSALGIPNNQTWRGIVALHYMENPRHQGWSLNLFAHAAGICPDRRVEHRMWKRFNSHQAIYLDTSLAYYPASQIDSGFISEDSRICQLYHLHFIALGCYMNYSLNRDAGMKKFADVGAQLSIDEVTYAPAYLDNKDKLYNPNQNLNWQPGTNEYLRSYDCITSADSFSINITSFSAGTCSHDKAPWTPVNGDKVQWIRHQDRQLNSFELPEGFDGVTPLYVVQANPSDKTFKISRTPGGPAIVPIPNTAAAGPILGYIRPADAPNVLTRTGGKKGHDSYDAIAYALLTYAQSLGRAGAAEVQNRARTWVDSATNMPGGQWDYWPTTIKR